MLRSYALLGTVYLGLQFLLRFFLLLVFVNGPFASDAILQIFIRGLWFDSIAAGFVLLPLLFLPERVKFSIGGFLKTLYVALFFFLVFFDAVSSVIFWSEFSTRYNFIAVDYLVYTHEVIGNIIESYPVWPIISVIVLTSIAALSLYIIWERKRQYSTTLNLMQRIGLAVAYIFILSGALYISDAEQTAFDNNPEHRELASNGLYNLFHAFWYNDLNYEELYYRLEPNEVILRVRQDMGLDDQQQSRKSWLGAATNNGRISPAIGEISNAEQLEREQSEGHKIVPADLLLRDVIPSSPEKRYNVVMVLMESMGAEYLGVLGNSKGLTTNLDRLAKEGWLFTQAYSTGTRTVRGIEALMLSIPPTPGQSIVRRPNNHNLYSLGAIFQDRGYSTEFIYGGYGYFDNMNEFFAGNGFKVMDRHDFDKEEITFASIWGVSDQDLFHKAVKAADDCYAKQLPFFQVILTTSNHRPFTYPEGEIDVPSGTGRAGAVKYADAAIGKFVAWAKTRPWFANTIFVFVADHPANIAGKVELDPKQHHIPVIFYAPELLQSRRIDRVVSQLDVGPILLEALSFHYRSKFYGLSLKELEKQAARVFIGNYQKVGLLQDDIVTVLAPKREVMQYKWPSYDVTAEEQAALYDTVSYYQSASWWSHIHRRINTKLQ